MYLFRNTFLLLGILFFSHVNAQSVLKGKIMGEGKPLESATIIIANTHLAAIANNNGLYEIKNIPQGTYKIIASAVGYDDQQLTVTITAAVATVNFVLEEQRSRLDEVIVTGVSRAMALRKNPVPVDVVTKKEMDINANNNIIDAVLKSVPGLSTVTTGPNVSKPFIRGLGYNRVLTMYDGMRQEGQQWGDEHGIEVDQYGIDRAEVVKGPASLTYGSDALAGVINLIPYVPKGGENKLNGDAVVDYHSNNGAAALSLGLAYRKKALTYSLRASGKIAHDYKNKIDGYVYNTGFHEYNLTGSVGIEKDWGYSRITATLYDNLQEIPDGSRDSLTRKFTYQANETAEDDIKARPLVPQDKFTSYALSALHQHIQHYRLYTHNKIKIGKSDINAMFGVQQSIRREYNHPTIPAQPGLYVVLNTFNYDLKYDLPAWKNIETTIGVNGMYQTNKSKDATDFPIPDYNLFDVGAYIFSKKSFDKIDISGGLRFDSRNINWNDLYIGENPETGFDQRVFLSDTTNAQLRFPAFKHHYTGVSGSIGATYNISQRVLVKANIARGYRSPNITEIGSNGLDPGAHIVYLGNRNFKPEFSLQEDIGVLAYLKDVDISVELFHNTIDNYIYQAKLYDASGQPVVIVPGNTTYQYQQSKAKLYGGEVTANLHPQKIKWLAFNNSLAVMQGLNKDETLLAKYGDAAKYLPFIPPLHTRTELRASFRKDKGIFSSYYLRGELEYYAAQNHFYAADNTETATAAYTLVNIGCGATIANKDRNEICKIFLQADNIFNVIYQSNLNRLKYFEYYTASPNGHLGIYNMGRNVSVKIIFSF